jgi:4-diphosphocytidyl-2C-methyl-D-erythritol kinase
MTGSGSAVFGLFEDDAALHAAARAATGSGYSVKKTRTLARREYLRASTPVAPRR